jgi:hypothetical protein
VNWKEYRRRVAGVCAEVVRKTANKSGPRFQRGTSRMRSRSAAVGGTGTETVICDAGLRLDGRPLRPPRGD